MRPRDLGQAHAGSNMLRVGAKLDLWRRFRAGARGRPPPRHPDGATRIVEHLLSRHRQTEVSQDPVRFFLVGCDFDCDVFCFAGHRDLDPTLITTVAKLYQAVLVEAEPADIALFSCLHQ